MGDREQLIEISVDGERLDDERSFVDWFVRIAGAWRLRAAVDVE